MLCHHKCVNIVTCVAVPVSVFIRNVDDPTPRFAAPWSKSNPTYSPNIEEEQPVNWVAFTAVAKSAVFTTNQMIYTEITDIGDNFNVNQTSGVYNINPFTPRDPVSAIQNNEWKSPIKLLSVEMVSTSLSNNNSFNYVPAELSGATRQGRKGIDR